MSGVVSLEAEIGFLSGPGQVTISNPGLVRYNRNPTVSVLPPDTQDFVIIPDRYLAMAL